MRRCDYCVAYPFASHSETTQNLHDAQRYSNVCGNKGYSLDFYAENERRRRNGPKNDKEFDRSRVREMFLNEIGFEECDWISNEPQQKRWWNNTFPNGKLHGVPVEVSPLATRDYLQGESS